jgi:hypothetical protein
LENTLQEDCCVSIFSRASVESNNLQDFFTEGISGKRE